MNIINYIKLLLYFVGEDLYLIIMKSELFASKDGKKVESDTSKYEFKERTFIKFNIIRDFKLIMRTPVLRANYVYVNFKFSSSNIIFKEGSGLKLLKVFPIEDTKYILSKVYVGTFTYALAFNALIFSGHID